MSIERDRKEHVYTAMLAEKAGRYEDIIESMKKVAKLDVELTIVERNYLSLGYKNVFSARRASWRALSVEEQKEDDEHNVPLIRAYRQVVENELSQICNDILTILDGHLIPSAETTESKVFYYKMKGDYYRYLAEFKTDQEGEEAATQSFDAYQAASNIANTDLRPADPVRLSVALNFSVFHYEILSSYERGLQMARQAFGEAKKELDTLSDEDTYKESTVLMQFLKDNITFWTCELAEGGD